MKTELEDFINDNIGAFNSRTPDAAVLERIQQQLKADRKKKERVPVISLRLRWAAAACLILLAGTVTILAIRKTEEQPTAQFKPKTQTDTPKQITTNIAEQKENTEAKETGTNIQSQTASEIPSERSLAQPRFAAIENEVNERKNVLFAKLTDKTSPSERLTAASQIETITSTDHDIVDALAKTMNTDPNTNVRLAALDALSKFYREPYVKKKLVSSLPQQKDPMVQIALIELLTKMKEVSILKQLNKMANDEQNIQAVKDQAYSGILTLRS